MTVARDGMKGSGSPPRKNSPSASNFRLGPWKIGVGLLVLAAVLWMLWPSPASRVANLDSRGAAIVAFGDSLTAGYGAAAGEDYPARLSALLGVPIVNRGVSGDTTAAALARLSADVLPFQPRIVIVGLGGNDFLRGEPIATTEENLRNIVRSVEGAGAMVVLLAFRFPSLSADYEEMYERVAEEERCLLVSRTLAGILTDPSLRSDSIHPNARGYQLMAERISGPLGELMDAANEER